MTVGQSLRWNNEDVGALAAISGADIVQARNWWRRHAPAAWRDLLTRAEWDAETQTYIVGETRVAERQVKAIILLMLLRRIEAERVRQARAMMAGEVGIGQWQADFAAELKQMHIATWAAGRGGFGQLTPRDHALIADRLRYQYGKLEAFARQVEAGFRQADSEGDVVGRTRLYVRAGNATYEDSKRDSHVRAGFQWERNVLGQAEHCAGCLTETARGWQPIGTLVPIGSRDCLANCKCRLIFSQSKPSD